MRIKHSSEASQKAIALSENPIFIEKVKSIQGNALRYLYQAASSTILWSQIYYIVESFSGLSSSRASRLI